MNLEFKESGEIALAAHENILDVLDHQTNNTNDADNTSESSNF